jgi:hypothetical protein
MGLTMTISFEIPIWAYISFAVFVWYFSVGLVIKQTTKQIIAERGSRSLRPAEQKADGPK